MVEAAFFDIFGIFAFTILLYIGMKFSRYKLKHIKLGGYVLIIIATLGLIVDTYNVMHKYIIPFLMRI
jgi:hypothetical protein